VSLAVSVVMATHNRAERLRAMLASLRAQTLPRDRYEIIVVDDASSDEGATRAVLEEHDDLRVLHRERSGGPGAARNDGWRDARAPLVAFTDDDCTVEPQWLEALLAVAAEHPGAIVQGRTDPMPDEWSGYSPFHYTLEIHEAGPSYETCNILYPREVLERLGGFDGERFDAGGEDTDLAWRAIRAGIETVFAEDAQVYHAVQWLGPVGKLKRAAHWDRTMEIFAVHPELRTYLVAKVFWKWEHYMLARTLLALALPKRLWPAKLVLVAPYMHHLTNRRTGPLLLPYLLLHDVIETIAVLRGAVRYRTLVI
jgi:glycosyltransferase involved in cell wall biosynthesis